MERDPALDHAGRLDRFLNRAIRDLKMTDATVTVIKPNQLNGKDDLVTSLTGAGSLATALTGRIAAAKARFAAANSKVDSAFGKLDNASVAIEKVALKVEAEADAAMAQLGQVSNMEPE
jgi:hypothetical protein